MVVYQSLWGNTAAVARAIAAGLGDDAVVGHTGEITPAQAAGATLLVVGSPVHALSLPTHSSVASVAAREVGPGEIPADVDQPLLKEWLAALPMGTIPAAAFDTRIKGFLGRGGASTIERLLKARGCRIVDKGQGFIVINQREVQESASMLREGELARASQWGEQLAALAAQA